MWTYNYSNELYHYGIPGQKWGVRRYQNKDGTLTKAGLRKQASEEANVGKIASKDAKRYADAKMFYGKTAGTRRKLLNAELNKKKKDLPGYEDAFNKAIESVDYAKSAKKAVTKRHAIDAKYRARVTTKQVLGITGPLTVAAGTALYMKNKDKVDSFVIDQSKKIANIILKKG